MRRGATRGPQHGGTDLGARRSWQTAGSAGSGSARRNWREMRGVAREAGGALDPERRRRLRTTGDVISWPGSTSRSRRLVRRQPHSLPLLIPCHVGGEN
uniref:Uncharacterized protein n=1 Tax=Arundo donax TaxID=35708 RepID=A0A0A9F2T1_ARUDO